MQIIKISSSVMAICQTHIFSLCSKFYLPMYLFIYYFGFLQNITCKNFMRHRCKMIIGNIRELFSYKISTAAKKTNASNGKKTFKKKSTQQQILLRSLLYLFAFLSFFRSFVLSFFIHSFFIRHKVFRVHN